MTTIRRLLSTLDIRAVARIEVCGYHDLHAPTLYALALQLERRRKREERDCGPDTMSQKLEHMRNRLLEAATDAERSGEWE